MRLTVVSGSSRGLGAAIVARLLQPGDTVIGLARRANPSLAALAIERGALLEQWTVDLAAEALTAAQRLEARLLESGGADWQRVVLVNNAGAISTPQPLRDAGLAELSTVVRVGLEATLLLGAAFLRATRGWPAERRMLNISSGLGRRPMAGSAAYCAAKAGIDHLSRCLALEEGAAPHGALVVSLAPGVIDTDMQQQLRNASATDFPDRERFASLHREGQLLSADTVAARVLAYLERPDFGAQPVADLRD